MGRFCQVVAIFRKPELHHIFLIFLKMNQENCWYLVACSWFWPTIFDWNFSILVHCKELDTAKKCLRKLSMPDSIFKMKTASYSTLSEFPSQNTDTPTHKVAKFWIFWNTQCGLFRKSTSCIHTIWQISAYYFLTYQDSRTVWPKSFEKIPNRFFIHSLQMALCSYLSISYLDKIWREVKFEYSLT